MHDLPENYDRLRVIECREEFFAASFDGRVNCMIHPRNLSGDFNELACRLYKPGAVWHDQFCTQQDLRAKLEDIACHEDNTGLAARHVISDIDTIESKDWRADLRVIGPGYYTYDVYAFHGDSDFQNPDNTIGHIFCPYTKPTPKFMRNEDAVFDSVTRYGVKLYRPKSSARVHSLPVGAFVRHMFEKKNSAAFLHAASVMEPMDPPRLFLAGVQPRIP